MIGRTALLGLLALALAGCAPAAKPAKPAYSGPLRLLAPAQIVAGGTLGVQVSAPAAADGQPVTLLLIDSYGPHLHRSALAGRAVSFVLSGEQTQYAGAVTLVAQAGDAQARAPLTILPGPPADPVTPLVGPRSVPVGGTHWTMLAAVPFDSYGNPVADGTQLAFRILHPDERLETKRAAVQNLVAWSSVYSSNVAGRSRVSVVAGDAHGPDVTFLEVPGWPTGVDISASPRDVPADGHQLVTLRTGVIRDTYGNPMEDGTLVTFVVRTPAGDLRFIPAYTIAGAAQAELQAPAEPGTIQVTCTLYGVESRPLAITFLPGPATGAVPLAARVNARDGLVALDAGPMLGPLQQFVPDATLVRFRIARAGHAPLDLASESYRGRAHVELRLADLASGTYTAEVQVGAGRGYASFKVP